jgi:hypothetical protein
MDALRRFLLGLIILLGTFESSSYVLFYGGLLNVVGLQAGHSHDRFGHN